MARKIDVLVIGNGPAGNNAAQAVRRTAPDLSVLILGEEAHPEYSAPALAEAMRRFAAMDAAAREARFAPLFEEARRRFAWPALARALAEG